jgi:hypothetical protein
MVIIATGFDYGSRFNWLRIVVLVLDIAVLIL